MSIKNTVWNCACLCGSFLFSMGCAGKSPRELWTLREGVNAPESAYYEPGTNRIYVSHVAGSPFEKDGNGYISQIDVEGKVIKEKSMQKLSIL